MDGTECLNATFKMLAHANEWANKRLYEAVAKLSDVDYRTNRGAFFGSMHGTLNHLLVADRIWMHRFTGKGDCPTQLNAVLFDDFKALRAAREAEDIRIVNYIERLTPVELSSETTFMTVSNPRRITQRLAPALSHFFNHQTHHRGQAHCLLTMMTGDAPSFDLMQYQREVEDKDPVLETGPDG